ncbi:MAG TPA: hypothetical protein VIG24_05520, partial [Acidimicrobiia bacterium]
PPDGGKPIPYTRVSTLAKTLDDKTALAKWMCRQTAIGMAQRSDLVSLVAASGEDKKIVGDAVEQAMAAAKSDQAANIGTTLHSLTEAYDMGIYDPQFTAHELQADIEAYEKATAGLSMDGIEIFVVNDELKAAGTFDRIVTLPDGRRMVADIKTGQNEPKYPNGVTTQVAIYARSRIYEPVEGRRQSLAEWGVSQTEGMMIHLPAGQAKCDLYILDLEIGYALATVATKVREMQKVKSLIPYTPEQPGSGK